MLFPGIYFSFAKTKTIVYNGIIGIVCGERYPACHIQHGLWSIRKAYC
jgi:hypothetical protein